MTETTLRAFLESRRVNKGEIFTHVIKELKDTPNKKGWIAGSYYIGKNDEAKFFNLYCKCVANKKYLTIAEGLGSSKYAPLRVDFDFKSQQTQGGVIKRQYNLKILKHIVKIFQDEIKNLLTSEVLDDKSILDCVILEKTAPRLEGKIIKDGFHIQFPNFICEGKIQDHHLRENVSKRMISEKVWPKNSKFSTPVDEFIDENMFRKPWMMYGSMNWKDTNSEPYIYKRTKVPSKNLGYALNYKQDIVKIGEMFKDSVETLKEVGNLPRTGKEKNPLFYLPELLSIRGHVNPTEIKNPYVSLPVKTRKKKSLQINHTKSEEEILEELKNIEECGFIDMLNDSRADSHESWMDLGWTLYSIGEGHEKAFQMWKDFSLRSSKFIEGECEEKWERMVVKDKTIGSLRRMAKHDDPKAYNNICTTQIKSLLWICVKNPEIVEFDIAKVFVSEFKDRYLCADPKRDVWYEFIGHKWKESNNGTAIRLLFATKLREIFSDFKNDIHYVLMQKEDVEDQKTINLQMKRCIEICGKLGQQNFHGKLIGMCRNLLYDHKFLDKLDTNRNLIGCENGVLDLELGHFREGRPDDYISMSTGIDYQEYDDNDEEMIQLEKFLTQIFPNPNLKRYYEEFIAFCLKGGNINKKFLIKTGSGNNGKTVITKLEEAVFGDYFGVIPSSAILEGPKISANAARPELAQNVLKRIISLAEPDAGKINVSAIKAISSAGDSMYVRELYKNGRKVTPVFTPILQCNDPPNVPYGDQAFWNRVRLLLFESVFVSNSKLKDIPVPKSFSEQIKMKRFHAEEGFDDKVGHMFAGPFLFKLFDTYNRIRSSGLSEPEEVQISTDSYRSENDVYLNFVKESLVKVSDISETANFTISPANMHIAFKEWYKDEFSINFTESRQSLIKKLNVHLGVKTQNGNYGFDKNKWFGWKLNTIDNSQIIFEDDDGR